MPQTALPNIGLDYDWALGADGWKTGMDDNLALLDNLAQPVINFALKSVSAQPGSPVNGDAYIIGASPTGADWAGSPTKENWFAVFYSGTSTWHFAAPREGWHIYDQVQNQRYQFDGTNWVASAGFTLRNVNADDTLVIGDQNNAVIFDGDASPSEMVLSVPFEASVNFDIGSRILIGKAGGGVVTIQSVAGSPQVAIGSPVSLVLNANNHMGFLQKVAADSWIFATFDSGEPFLDESAASYTLALKHDNALILIAGGDTTTIPDESVALAIGTSLRFVRTSGGGNHTVSPVSSSPEVLLNGATSGITIGNSGGGMLTKVAVRNWILQVI